MSAKHAMLCAHCGIQFESDKDWPIQTCSICWRDGWSVTKAGKVYQKKDPAKAVFAAKPAAQPATPNTTQSRQASVQPTGALAAGNVAVVKKSAVGGTPLTGEQYFSGVEQLIREMQAMKKELLAALRPQPVEGDMDLYPSDPAGGAP